MLGSKAVFEIIKIEGGNTLIKGFYETIQTPSPLSAAINQESRRTRCLLRGLLQKHNMWVDPWCTDECSLRTPRALVSSPYDSVDVCFVCAFVKYSGESFTRPRRGCDEARPL